MLPAMYTVVRGGAVLGEGWEREVRWVPFVELVKEQGTERSFIRFLSPETAAPVAAKVGGRTAEVLVQRGGGRFEIVLYRPPGSPAAQPGLPAQPVAPAPSLKP